jgi:penicillin-binding protein 1C
MKHLPKVGVRMAIGFSVPAIAFAVLTLISPLPALKPHSVVVEDREGRFVHAFRSPDGMWRLRTPPSEIPERLKRILLRKEDRWFYYHPGVNPFSLVRALAQNITTGQRVSGASTITMQIARMMEPKERTYLNKVIEIFRALQLEMRYSKEELLELYLSMVPLGGNIEGLRSAAYIYYQTPLERLNIARLIDLILIPTDPNRFRPDRNAELLQREREQRSLQWLQEGLLTQDDSMVIWNTPALAQRHPLPRLAPHFALRVREQGRAQSDIRTYLDLQIQSTVEQLLTNHLRPWKQIGVKNGAVLVVENATGGVVAYAGSQRFDDTASQGQVDAVRALRSPGSTLKPFLYALLMDRGDLTPHIMLLDVPFDAEGYQAENYDGTYSGPVYAADALRKSLNVPMVRLLRRVGITPLVDLLGQLGVASIPAQRQKLGLSMILGGCGVTLEELTAAYRTFPAGGTYQPLQFAHVEEHIPRQEVFSPSAAYMVTDILSGMERPDVPNNFASARNLPVVAFKTGTSYGRRDAWSVGYSAEYTVGVWIGNVDNKGNPELVGSKSAAPLLFDIFNSISTVHQKGILPVPHDIRVRQVCAFSGASPGPWCAQRIDDLASATRTTNAPCTFCREILVTSDRKHTLCPTCIGTASYHSSTYVDFPAELLAFWRSRGRTVDPPPSHNPLCTQVAAGEGPLIVSPSDHMTYFLFDGNQKLLLQASSDGAVEEHRWYVDDRFLGSNRVGEKMFAKLDKGDHTIACVDTRGRLSQVRISVKSGI